MVRMGHEENWLLLAKKLPVEDRSRNSTIRNLSEVRTYTSTPRYTGCKNLKTKISINRRMGSVNHGSAI